MRTTLFRVDLLVSFHWAVRTEQSIYTHSMPKEYDIGAGPQTLEIISCLCLGARMPRGRDALVSRDTQFLVQWDNSLPGAVLAAFAPLGGVLRCFRLQDPAEGR